jgi:hypothetical protein
MRGRKSLNDMKRFGGSASSVRVLTALAALAALLMLAPAATTDTTDDAYLSALATNDITSAQGSAVLIQVGQAICTDTNAGITPAMEGIRLAEMWHGGADRGGLTPAGAPGMVNNAQAASWVHSAIISYCPNGLAATHWGVQPYPHNPEGPYGTCKEGGACW